MSKVEVSFGQRFVGPRGRYFGLERIQLSLLAQLEFVYQDGRVFVGVRVVNRIVHAAGLALAIAAHDRAAIFLGRQAFPASFRGPLFHGLGQMNPLDRANLGKMRAADHEATHLGTLCGHFFLLRHGNIVAYSDAVGRPCGIGVCDRRTPWGYQGLLPERIRNQTRPVSVS